MKVTLIPGDGIGPEIVGAAVRCVEAAVGPNVIEWETMPAGESALSEHGEVLPEATLCSIKKNKVALKGPLTTPVGKGFRSVNVALRKELRLFANVRPAKIYPGVKTPYENVDLVVIRENLEDLYAGIEFKRGELKHRKVPKDAAVSLKTISVKNSRNIIDFAFQHAKKNKRNKVTAVHKANILKYTDGLFLDTFYKVAKKYRIAAEDRIVDNMCMQLVQKPQDYEVLVCPNLYGDVVSDLCSGLVGGLGVAPSMNYGTKYAVFEAVHGSAPQYAGENRMNPVSMTLSGVLMLRHLGKKKEADRLEKAVAAVIKKGTHVTYDLATKKAVGTSEMADAIIQRLR